MTAAVDDRLVSAGAIDGGAPARRAVIRWAWRLLRREWRQQLLIVALIAVAVAATFVGSTVATNTPVPVAATFGTANDLANFPGSTADLPAKITALAHDFGRIDVIENQTLPVPGSVLTYSLRAQNPHGPFGQPMLSLVSGHYPSGAGQVALTTGVASELGLKVGASWRADGMVRRVVGIVANPLNLLDEFALVAPGQVTRPTQVSVLFDASAMRTVPAALTGATVQTRASSGTANAINPETISLAAATLGMLLIALVSIGGFTVLAQRRLRSIGMLGAQGATDENIGLVIRANGLATGIAGAVAGAALGMVVWLAYRPRAEASAHHLMGAFQLPWLVVAVSMVLAVVAAYLAASRPARAIARVPIVAALAGRPPAPRQARRTAVPAGLALLVIAFFLIGLAAEKSTSGGGEAFLGLMAGLIALCVGVVLIAPACLPLLARFARRGPVVVRLALRDLARYQVRSGAALAAISVSVVIAVVICVIAAGRFGNTLDYVGPNLATNQLIVDAAGPAPVPGQIVNPRTNQQQQPGATGGASPTAADLTTMAAKARGIAASLGSDDVIQLVTTTATLRHAAAGRNWTGLIYVATPELLRAYGISAARVSPAVDILTMRPGVSTTTHMQLLYGPSAFGNDAQPANGRWPCPANSCRSNPTIEQVSALPSGTAAPNTVLTEHAVRQLRLPTTTVGWLIQTSSPLTAAQISGAERAAGAAGMTVETRDSIPTLSEIIDVATIFGMLLALGILGMSVALLRSETATQLRTLTAAGASGTARRAISATTAGALALIGAVAGTAGGYIAAIGFFRTSQLDPLSALTSIPVANLLLILVGLPLFGVIGGWLLAGREPAALGRRPLE